MYFHIASELLTDDNNIEIHTILNFALLGALFIKLGVNNDEVTEKWLKSRPPAERERWDVITKSSAKAETKYRTLDKIEVIAGSNPSDWTADPPRLNLTDAVVIAGQAKRVIVENSRGDRNFILAMADNNLRERMLELEATGRLMFVHGGGIGELKMQLLKTHIPVLGSRYFCWVLIDSDSASPGAISKEAQDLLNICAAAGIKHYCLERRAIENYLPKQTMLDAIGKNVLTEEDRPKVEAFFNLASALRHHFHMKRGLDDATCRDSGQYDPKSDPNVAALRKGFGGRISDIYGYEDNELSTMGAQFSADGATTEMSQPFKQLKAMIRGLV